MIPPSWDGIIRAVDTPLGLAALLFLIVGTLGLAYFREGPLAAQLFAFAALLVGAYFFGWAALQISPEFPVKGVWKGTSQYITEGGAGLRCATFEFPNDPMRGHIDFKTGNSPTTHNAENECASWPLASGGEQGRLVIRYDNSEAEFNFAAGKATVTTWRPVDLDKLGEELDKYAKDEFSCRRRFTRADLTFAKDDPTGTP